MRGYDPVPAWRYLQRLEYDESIRVDRDARRLNRVLVLVGLAMIVAVMW